MTISTTRIEHLAGRVTNKPPGSLLTGEDTRRHRAGRRERVDLIGQLGEGHVGGYARVPLRSPRGNLAGQLATLSRELLACGSALAWKLHLPPSAVSFVSDVRFCRSAQRLARLT